MRTIIPMIMILIGSLTSANAQSCRGGYSYSAPYSYSGGNYVSSPTYYITKRIISGYNSYGHAIYKTIRVPRTSYSSGYSGYKSSRSSYSRSRGSSSRSSYSRSSGSTNRSYSRR